ncbi:hypothetical protein AAFF_G00029870 [Aldrovandia affinis]|uniref:Uncharacterized protein n=1 Tax=Aldrovandia affinis TaxID=143900 RepID=A0AAD7S4D7_9TELE|nr:hypothetical protein AAFF_G00029870 [Aldrovandia affinis]
MGLPTDNETVRPAAIDPGEPGEAHQPPPQRRRELGDRGRRRAVPHRAGLPVVRRSRAGRARTARLLPGPYSGVDCASMSSWPHPAPLRRPSRKQRGRRTSSARLQARQPAPASAKLTATRRRKSAGHAHPCQNNVAAATAVTSQDT